MTSKMVANSPSFLTRVADLHVVAGERTQGACGLMASHKQRQLVSKVKLKIRFLCFFIVQMEDLAKVVDKVFNKNSSFFIFISY